MFYDPPTHPANHTQALKKTQAEWRCRKKGPGKKPRCAETEDERCCCCCCRCLFVVCSRAKLRFSGCLFERFGLFAFPPSIWRTWFFPNDGTFMPRKLRVLLIVRQFGRITLNQHWANYGPGEICRPLYFLIRPVQT